MRLTDPKQEDKDEDTDAQQAPNSSLSLGHADVTPDDISGLWCWLGDDLRVVGVMDDLAGHLLPRQRTTCTATKHLQLP